MINQNPAHHLRGYAEEMSAVLPVHLSLIDKAQISLVDKRGRLQSVTRALQPQVAVGHAAQFLIYGANYIIQCLAVSTAPGNQPLGDLLMRLVDFLMWRWLFHLRLAVRYELACVEPN